MALISIIMEHDVEIGEELLKARIREFQGEIQSVEIDDDAGDAEWFVSDMEYFFQHNLQIELHGWRGDTIYLEDLGGGLWSVEYSD
jgi:hypothetical protein